MCRSSAPICRLHTVTTGDTDKPLMLLLHGFLELWTMWEHQMSAFRDECNVAAIDVRGYGRSDRPTVSHNDCKPDFSTLWQPTIL